MDCCCFCSLDFGMTGEIGKSLTDAQETMKAPPGCEQAAIPVCIAITLHTLVNGEDIVVVCAIPSSFLLNRMCIN